MTARVGKENAPKGSLVPEDFQGSVEDYISLVYEHQKLCQKKGKYLEADLAKKKLVELKAQLQSRVKAEMRERHRAELQEVEKAHREEFAQFNGHWDAKMAQCEAEALQVDAETRARHGEEMRGFQEEVERSLGPKPRETPEMINLRRIEESLAKVESYQEAHRVQQRVQELARAEAEKWAVARGAKVRNLLTQLQARQDGELGATRQRIESCYELEKRAREDELEK